MEKKYGDSEWFENLTAEPMQPIESILWRLSFDGESNDETDLPYQLAHIWNYLLEVGPVSNGGMGPIPLSFFEIKNWIDVTGVRLSSWESALLRKCSQEWIAAQYSAKVPNAIPPWNLERDTAKILQDRRKYIADQLKNFGGSGKRKKGKE